MNAEYYKKQAKIREEAEKKEKERLEKVSDLQKELSDEVADQISENQDRIIKEIEWGNKKIQWLQDDLKKLWQNTQESIVKRVVEIDDELEKEDLEPEDRQKLEEERAKAFINLTQQEKDALKEKINAEKEFQELTEIEQIRAKAEQEKEILQGKLDKEIELQQQRLDELQASKEREQEIQESLTAVYEKEIWKKVWFLQKLINKTKELQSLQAQTGTNDAVSTAQNITNNNNRTVNIGTVRANSTTDLLSRTPQL